MNTRKKIMFLITKATWGGAQRYVYDLATSAPQQEFEVHVAYGTGGKLAAMLNESHIQTTQLSSLQRDVGLISDIRSFFEIRGLIKELRPDIVHLNSSKAAGLGALAARLSGVPRIIFTVHGWPFKEERGALSTALIYFTSWITGFLSHSVIVVSHKDLDSAKRMFGLRKKTTLIIPALQTIEFEVPEIAYKRMFGTLAPPPISTDTVRLVSIAELTKNKGLSYALEAVALLRERGVDSIYVIVGDGEEKKTLETKVQSLGISDRVFFPGFVESAFRYLTGFDVFLMPSIKEGTPYALLEARAAGMPIVVTSVIDDSLLAHVSHARTIPSHDSHRIADAAEELSKIPHSKPSSRSDTDFMHSIEATLSLYR